MTATASTATTATATGRPTGKIRSPGKVFLLALVTIGIYWIVWEYKTYEEIKDYLGDGWPGIVGVLLGIAAPWKIPSEVGTMYERDGQPAPVSGKTGFWVFLPGAGGIVWLFKVQGALNRFWESKGATA